MLYVVRICERLLKSLTLYVFAWYHKYMNIVRPKNTKERGLIEYFMYKDGGKFVGVCLTFDIVEEGQDPVALMKSIEEASALHLEVVIKERMSDDLLNRYAPSAYWSKYFQALKQIQTSNGSPSAYFRRSPYHQTRAVAIA